MTETQRAALIRLRDAAEDLLRGEHQDRSVGAQLREARDAWEAVEAEVDWTPDPDWDIYLTID